MHETCWDDMALLSDPLHSMEHMFDHPASSDPPDDQAIGAPPHRPPPPPDRQALHEALDRLLDAEAADPGPVLGEALAAAHRLQRLVEGRAVALLPAHERSREWWRAGAVSPVSHLVQATGVHRTHATKLRRTALDADDLPHVRAAAEAGSLSLSHLHLLTRARQPDVAQQFDAEELGLVAEAHQLGADALRAHLERWRIAALEKLRRNDKDPRPGPTTEADTLSLAKGVFGRGVGHLDLTPEGLATLREAIDAEVTSWSGSRLNDPRTLAEQQAAALLAIVQRGARRGDWHGAPRPLVIATTTLGSLLERADVPVTAREPFRADIVNGGPIDRATLAKLVCEADISLVVTDDHGEPLWVGRATRRATAAQHRALIARSGGTCEWPGCTTGHQGCRDHHLHFWDHGGPTDLPNLALICQHHHTLIHEHGFQLGREDGELVARTAGGVPLHPRCRTAA
jgi:hypothetical protein